MGPEDAGRRGELFPSPAGRWGAVKADFYHPKGEMEGSCVSHSCWAHISAPRHEEGSAERHSSFFPWGPALLGKSYRSSEPLRELTKLK